MPSSVGENTTTTIEGVCDVVTDNIRDVFIIVNFGFICQIISIFGTVTNIINIVCFVKQGLRDPVNISLLGLTVADLLSLLTLIWLNVSVNPWISQTDLPYDFQHTSYLTAAIPHVAFTRITCWVTAFISLERCLCVALPVKIKSLFNRKRAIIINTAIYLVIYISYVTPGYYSTTFATVEHPRKPNTTWLGISYSKDRAIIERYSFAINNFLLPFAAFTVISVSTVVLVVKLKSKTKWRQNFVASLASDSISSRDQSLSKMVVMISTMFIFCYAPVCVIFVFIIAVPKVCRDSMFGNMYTILFSFAYILESINASFNIFSYYKVSSRYRQTFKQVLIGRCRGKIRADNC